MDRAHAARRPLGRAVLEQSATPAYVLTVEQGFAPLDRIDQFEHADRMGRPREPIPAAHAFRCRHDPRRSEEHTSELQSLMRISYAVFCLKKKKNNNT